jgi:hypothetical protein
MKNAIILLLVLVTGFLAGQWWHQREAETLLTEETAAALLVEVTLLREALVAPKDVNVTCPGDASCTTTTYEPFVKNFVFFDSKDCLPPDCATTERSTPIYLPATPAACMVAEAVPCP